MPQDLRLDAGINFTTFNTAKGLEFHDVIVAESVNPDLHSRLGDEFDWDLERRLLYVAMTRTMIHIKCIRMKKIQSC